MEEREAKIMSEIAEGNISAFREIVGLHQKPLINFISRFIGDKTTAEDIAQEVFIKVFKAAKAYRPKSKFKTWLFKIASNLCLNQIRDNKNRPQIMDIFELNERGCIAIAPDNCCSEKMCAKKKRSEVVRAAIINLPKKQRVAILLQKYCIFRSYPAIESD
jgi:RNA polymerase sigma-70 factor (ECF subfamily)